MSNKWYKKASVQAALINAIPTFLVAVISIISIIITCDISNNQIDQNTKLSLEKYKKDSLLVDLQLKLAKDELEINRKQLLIIDKNNKLNESLDKSELHKLCLIIWDKLNEFYKDNNPKPQSLLEVGKFRTIKTMSDLRLHYDIQNKWAQELSALFSSGYSNKYLLSIEDGKNQWNNSLVWCNYIKIQTDAFLNNDSTFIKFYNFDKFYVKVSDSFVLANKILFENTKNK